MEDRTSQQAATTSVPYRWLLSLSVALLLVLLPFSAYIVSLPLLQSEWQINNTQSGFIFSSYLIGYALSSLLIIPLTDRHSTRAIFLAGLIVLITGNLLFPLLAHNLWTGAAIRALTGAGQVAAYVPAIRLISQRVSGRARGTAIGIFVGAGYAGTTLSYAITGLLMARMDTWQQAYFATSLIGLLGLFIALPLLLYDPSDLPTTNLAATDPTSRAETRTDARPQRTTPGQSGRLDLSILRNRAISLCTTGYALHTAELYLARLWFPLLLTAAFLQKGLDLTLASTQAGTWSGLMFMTGIIGVFSGGYISDRIGRTAGAAIIFTVSGLCSFAAGWLISLPALLIALGFVYGLMTAADSAIYSTAIIELSPTDRVGSAQAIQSFIGFSIGAAAPILVGAILDASNTTWQWIAAFSTNGALAILGILALLWLRRLPEAFAMAGGRR